MYIGHAAVCAGEYYGRSVGHSAVSGQTPGAHKYCFAWLYGSCDTFYGVGAVSRECQYQIAGCGYRGHGFTQVGYYLVGRSNIIVEYSYDCWRCESLASYVAVPLTAYSAGTELGHGLSA